MLGAPPPLWSHLMRHLRLRPWLAWTWWRSVVKSQDAAAIQWRDAFFQVAGQDAAVETTEEISAVLGDLATLTRLIALIETLVDEQALSRREGAKIEEHLFSRADKDGQFYDRRGRMPA